MEGPDVDLVLETAALARLEVDAGEARTLGPQFAAILKHFEVLSELDVEGVEPTSVVSTELQVRTDEVRPSMPRDALVGNAPDPREGFYGVPRAIPKRDAGGQGGQS
ncbi:MAG: Asp-tRNA(Asn)/Glu-tRNA(Gln) amidotransferase subunit GatC [bacterium]|nr:Asp-tRNA(Asn)/Glu-tRNA(Gln) amidotransferase subunit GatC [bacterium]